MHEHDRQTDRPRNDNIDRNRWNRLSAMSPNNKYIAPIGQDDKPQPVTSVVTTEAPYAKKSYRWSVDVSDKQTDIAIT